MKKVCFLILFTLTFAYASMDGCKTDIYFGNGILTEKKDARFNAGILRSALIDKFTIDYYYEYINQVDYAYNSTHGFVWDNLESALQKLGWTGLWDFFGATHGRDIERQVTKYKNSILSGNNVLIVAHSQGNLFARDAYQELPIWMQNYFEAVSIASPMSADIKDGTTRIDWDNDLSPELLHSEMHFLGCLIIQYAMLNGRISIPE